MIEKHFNGDLLKADVDIICHQVNTRVMGGGIAYQIRCQFPHVYKKYLNAVRDGLMTVGSLQVVKIDPEYIPAVTEKKQVFGITFEQGRNNFKIDGNGRYTNYEALYTVLEKLADYCSKNGVKKIGFPTYMSCVRGGGDWEVVTAMIKSVFRSNPDIEIQYWRYDKG